MQFTKKDLDEFREIYRDEFNEEITDDQVQEMGDRLVYVLRLLRKPLPSEVKREGVQQALEY